MMYFAHLEDRDHRVAVLGYPAAGGVWVEWLEGPRHGQREVLYPADRVYQADDEGWLNSLGVAL